MNPADEADWVRQARGGDRAAFTALVDRYWERLRRWLYGLCGKEHLAEDLTQEAFVRAWASLSKLETAETFRVWLFRIARNCLLDNRRGPRGVNPRLLPPDLAGMEADPLDELLENEVRQLVQAALTKLPTPYRAAYLLWTHEEMPYHQIALVLAVSEETARWRVCKARQFLAKKLQAYLNDSKR